MRRTVASWGFGLLTATLAVAQGAPPAAAPAPPSQSPAARAALAARVEEFNARFRETHGGLGPEQFGIQCCQILQIPAAAFTPRSAGEAWSYDANGYMHASTFGTDDDDLWAPVMLPTGSLISWVGLYYFDTNPTYDIFAKLTAYSGGAPSTGLATETVLATAASSGSSGLGYVATPLSYTVDNNVEFDGSAAQLAVVIRVLTNSNTVEFKAVDIWWARQISPPPATQTFNDVAPGDFGYAYVEALAASGVTGGCGGGNYCPNANLTRAQMAVFLSKALGLYWPY